MRAYVIDAEMKRCEAVDIDNSLTAFYEVIRCDCIDIVVRTIGGRRYNIIVDDEGLLKPNHTSGVCSNYGEILAGAIIVCAMDQTGDICSINEDDEAIIKDNVVKAVFPDMGVSKVLRYQI